MSVAEVDVVSFAVQLSVGSTPLWFLYPPGSLQV